MADQPDDAKESDAVRRERFADSEATLSAWVFAPPAEKPTEGKSEQKDE